MDRSRERVARPLLFSLLAAFLSLGGAVAAQAQTDFSGSWSPEQKEGRGPLRRQAFNGVEGRSATMTVEQTDSELRINEDVRAGRNRTTRSYVLVPDGQERTLNYRGREGTVVVTWDGEQLVIESPQRWRETWRLDGDSLTIFRRDLRRGVHARAFVLNRNGGGS